MAPPWSRSVGLVFCTPKCRGQRENRSEKRSKQAPQRPVQKLMESIGFFVRSERPKIGPPFGSICASVVAIFGVDFGSSLVRIDGSLFLHPKMSETDGKFVQKKVKNGTPKICPKIDAKCMIFSRFETPQNLTPFEPICASVVVILGSRFAPPWFGSTGLRLRTLKCRKQTGNLPKRRSKLAPQRFNQKLMQSV